MKRHPSAFALIELLAVVLLLAGFAVIFADVFSVTILAQRSAVRSEELSNQFDSAMATLRRDVWNARTFRGSPDSLELTLAGDQRIVWSQTSAGALTRSAPGEPDRTWRNAPPVRFTFRGPVLTLTVPTPPPSPIRGASRNTGQPDAAVFVSQWLLAQGGRS